MKYQEKNKIQVTSYEFESSEGSICCRIYAPLFPGVPGILFFSGFPGYQRNFDLALELALSGFAVGTFDYPGTWDSKGKFYPLVGLKIGKEVKQFLSDLLSSSRWGIFGHSWGATLALLYGAQDPSLKSITLLAVVNDLLTITGGTRESVAQMFINDAASLGIEINRKKLEGNLNVIASKNILGDTISQIKQPVLLIHGSEDREVPLSQSQQVLKLSNNEFTLKILPGEEHNPKNRKAIANVLLEWYKNTL